MIFEKMLETEAVSPEKLAYDRPSEKLISFMGRHFGLKKYVPQNNNFVVFDAYWDTNSHKPRIMQSEMTSHFDRFKEFN
jgi:alpha-tubulin N-acetyltransferase 1